MSNFDVFVNGIQPDYATKIQQVIEEFSEKLRVEHQKAEKIIKTPNTRIKQSTSKEEAEKLQQTLHKIGVICICRPSHNTTSLSLEPIEIKEEGDVSACPSCNHKFSGNSNIVPEKCDSCGVYIKKFLINNEEQIEKDAIKQKLLQKDSIRNAREQREREENAEEIRKKILEQAVINETPNLKKNKKSKKQTFILVGGATLAISAACFSYVFFGQKESSKIIDSSSNIASAQESFQETDDLLTEIPQSSDLSQESDGLATGIPDGTSQNALQNTHDQASQALDAFGLDADAFAKNHTGASGKSKSNSNLSTATPTAIPTTFSSTDLGNSSELSSQNRTVNGIPNTALSPFLLEIGVDEQEWAQYLTKKAEQSIKRNNLSTAIQIIPYLIETEKYIELSGKVYKKTRQSDLKAEINSNIEAKTNSTPVELQPQLLSQAALIQDKKRDADLFFNKADNSWKTISNPNKQLASAMRVAVSYFKSGNTTVANRYFNKIKPLLSKITDVDGQISSRVAISRAFQEVGQSQIAFNWLNSTDKLINNADKSSLHELVKGYAYLNQLNKINTLVTAAPNLQDELLYSAINASLNTGFTSNAVKLIDQIKNPTIKALAYTSIASRIEDNTSYLVSAETLLNKTIKELNHQAIVASRIAQQYARLDNTSKVTELFQKTKQFVKLIPSSAEKDKLLGIIAMNYAYSLNEKSASILSSYIQSPITKSNITDKLSLVSKISGLLET